MIRLEAALHAWGTPEFKDLLLDELMRQDALSKLMQLGLTYGTVALLENVKLGILDRTEDGQTLRVTAGVHYSSITTGCNCIDDPSPLSEMPEYVDVLIVIDRATGEAKVSLA